MAGIVPVGGSASGKFRRRRFTPIAEINVTPLVDVMLVLLVIFMITAPLLTVGVPVELPKTKAASMTNQEEPLVISVKKDGTPRMISSASRTWNSSDMAMPPVIG